MKRIEIEIMRSSDALNAAIDTWHKAKAGKKVTPRISFGSIKDLFSAITEKRLELLRLVEVYQGRVLELGLRSLIVELTGERTKVEAALEVLGPFGIKEMSRTGMVALARDRNVT